MRWISSRAWVCVAAVALLAGGWGLGGRTSAQGEKGGGKGPEAAGSGKTVSGTATRELELEVKDLKVRALAGGLSSFFTRITPDASPGRNSLVISGLPAGTRVVSVWMTEWLPGNQPHAGGAFFYTNSVQLFNNGTQCRVIFNLEWGAHLPTACQVIFGPG